MPWLGTFSKFWCLLKMVITRLFGGEVVQEGLCMKCPMLRTHKGLVYKMANSGPLLKVLSLWQSLCEVSLVQSMFKLSGFKLGFWKCHMFFSSFKYASSISKQKPLNIYSDHFVSGLLQRFLVSLYRVVAHYTLVQKVVQCCFQYYDYVTSLLRQGD